MYYDKFFFFFYYFVEFSTNFCIKIIFNSLALEKDVVLII